MRSAPDRRPGEPSKIRFGFVPPLAFPHHLGFGYLQGFPLIPGGLENR
jgi:hypothetical protein